MCQEESRPPRQKYAVRLGYSPDLGDVHALAVVVAMRALSGGPRATSGATTKAELPGLGDPRTSSGIRSRSNRALGIRRHLDCAANPIRFKDEIDPAAYLVG